MKIEKLSNHTKYAQDYQRCLVFENWEDYVSYMNHEQESVKMLIDFFAENRSYPRNEYFPNVLTFVKNGKQAREFVEKSIYELYDPDYISVQQYAKENGYRDAYEVLSGEADGFARFMWSKTGCLIDTIEV